jgi:hypothetical protein
MADTPPPGEFKRFFSDVWRLLTGKPQKTSAGAEVDHLGRARRFIQGLPRRAAFSAASQAARAAAKVFGKFAGGLGAKPQPYTDSVWYPVKSSWIIALLYVPMTYRAARAVDDQYGKGRSAGFVPMPGSPSEAARQRGPDRAIGDLTMKVVVKPRADGQPNANPSGNYTYPRVPRYVMDDWVAARTGGTYYHAGEIRAFSDRRGIFQRALVRQRDSSKRPRK